MVSLETVRVTTAGLLLLICYVVWLVSDPMTTECHCLQVSFFDVGQGDAVYLRTPDGYEVLVDGGRGGSVLQQLAEVRSFFDRQLDVVVATHPDADHIGGLLPVLTRYDVHTVVMTTAGKETAEAQQFERLVAAEEAAIILADAGQRFLLGASTTLTIFSPTGDESRWETNNASVVLKVSYGDTDVLLTGDASQEVEEYLVSVYGEWLEAEILKLGHHGSKTSSSGRFLDTVEPQYAVVSAGLDNRYGHPHQEVLRRVSDRNIQTFHTGIDGTVTFFSDGQRIMRDW